MNNDDLTSISQQLIDLQTQFSFQEDVLQALNDVVSKQQAEIEQLSKENEEIRTILRSQTDKLNENERPPHY